MRGFPLPAQPGLSTPLARSEDADLRDFVEQVRREYGVGRVIQTANGGYAGLYYDPDTGGLMVNHDGAWKAVAGEQQASGVTLKTYQEGDNSGLFTYPVTFGEQVTVKGLSGITKATSGVLGNVTVGTSLSWSDPTLDTIQDIRTTATPQFAGMTLTGALTMPAGTRTAPAMHASDADTGVYWPGEGQFGIAAGSRPIIVEQVAGGTGLQIVSTDGVAGRTYGDTLRFAGGAGLATADDFDTGGTGGQFVEVSGAGGAASGEAATGGNGGPFLLDSGIGGEAAGASGTGGNGGTMTLRTGGGGDAGGTGGTGGNGGDVLISLGLGGTGTAASGTNGAVRISSGVTSLLDLATTGIVVNEDSADIDVRVEGNSDANLLYVDAGADRVGIGDAAPGHKLDVAGDANVTGVYRVDDAAGVNGSFTTADSKTVTVAGGIITGIA